MEEGGAGMGGADMKQQRQVYYCRTCAWVCFHPIGGLHLRPRLTGAQLCEWLALQWLSCAVSRGLQGLVFACATESGVVKLYDVRSYDKGPFDTFVVGAM